jgi:hypothetical protein
LLDQTKPWTWDSKQRVSPATTNKKLTDTDNNNKNPAGKGRENLHSKQGNDTTSRIVTNYSWFDRENKFQISNIQTRRNKTYQRLKNGLNNMKAEIRASKHQKCTPFNC